MRCLAAALLVLSCASPAGAQSVVRGFLAVNAVYSLTSEDFADTGSVPRNAEIARFGTRYHVQRRPAFDVAAGMTIWRSVGIGVGFAWVSRPTPGTFTGAVPHPFFFNRDRPVSGIIDGLTLDDMAVHVQARVVAPIGNQWQLALFGGPSFFRVTQSVVTGFDWTDAYPYDEARLGAVTTMRSRSSRVGFSAGGDLAVFVTRHLGLGASVQISRATLQLPVAGGATQEITAGGIKAGGGLRLRF